MLKIGIARGDITPRANMAVAGYGKRVQPSLGVSDPLYATVLVAESDGSQIAVVDCDLVGVGLEFANQVRRTANERTGIPDGNIMICCSHSHYGPNVVKEKNDDWSIGDYHRQLAPKGCATDGPGAHEHAYRVCLMHQLADLIQAAKRNVQPARISVGIGASDIGVCRRVKRADGSVTFGENPSAVIDRALGVCRIETLNGEPLAAVVNFATHPVSQDPQLRMFSADYVGFVRRLIQQETGALCLFLQGASGDINPLGAETTYENARNLGMRLGCDAARLWYTAEPIRADSVQAVRRRITLPPYRGLSQAHAAQIAAAMEAHFAATMKDPRSTENLKDWYKAQLKRVTVNRDSWSNAALMPPAVSTEIQAFRIGQLALAGVPTELFSEVGVEIKQRSPFKPTFVATHANDYFGYLPALRIYAEGGYEVDETCAVAPEGITAMVNDLASMFKEL